MENKKKQKVSIPKPPKEKVQKLTKRQFLSILRENGGIYAQTARAIQTKYKIAYTRQSVRVRAMKYPDIESDISEENVDEAETYLMKLCKKADTDAVRLRALDIYLRSKGKLRGYGDALDITSGNKPIEPFSGVLPIHKPIQDTEKA